MDSRMVLIIKNILETSYASRQDLMARCSLTKRQMDYGLEKVNDLLVKNNCQKIRIVNDQLLIAPATKSYLSTYLALGDVLLFNSSDRQFCLFLILATTEADVSLPYLMELLQVSKSTVSKDLKQLEESLLAEGIRLSYSRQQGYLLEGQENTIRSYLMKRVMLGLEEQRKVLERASSLIGITYKFDEIFTFAEELGQKLSIKFVENRLKEFVFSLMFLMPRFMKLPDYQETFCLPFPLEETDEYDFACSLQRHFDKMPMACLPYLTTWLLGATESQTAHSHEETQTLNRIVGNLMTRFQYLSGISFVDKPSLKKQLFKHFRSAHYRLLFHIPITNPLLEKIENEYDDLFSLVEATLKPYEREYSLKVPKEEIGFLVLHFASSLQGSYQKPKKKIQAAISCPNGIGVSMLLYTQLRSLFPEFDFTSPFSAEESDEGQLAADLIFSSSGELKKGLDNKKIITVPPVMNALEKEKLKMRVAQEIGIFKTNTPQLNTVMEVVAKHVAPELAETIERELVRIFYSSEQAKELGLKPKAKLHEAMSDELIILNSKAKNKKQAILAASQPLLEAGLITDNYIQKMVASSDESGGHMVISKHVAMPHASIQEGALGLGIGLTILEKAIAFGSPANDPVKYIFTLSTPDKESHLQALSTLVELLGSSDFLTMMESAKTPKDIIQHIQKFEISNAS